MMNQMLATVCAGKMTFQELAGVACPAVLPIAAANKISYAQVGGALATMTSHGRVGAAGHAGPRRHHPHAWATRRRSRRTRWPSSASTRPTCRSQLGSAGLTGTIGYLSATRSPVKMGTSRPGPGQLDEPEQGRRSRRDARCWASCRSPSRASRKAYLDGEGLLHHLVQRHEEPAAAGARRWPTSSPPSPARPTGSTRCSPSGSPRRPDLHRGHGKMLGGATGLNVGLMLTGSHAATFARERQGDRRTQRTGRSGKVSGFAQVQQDDRVPVGAGQGQPSRRPAPSWAWRCCPR